MKIHNFKWNLFNIEYSSVKKSDLYWVLRLNAEFYEPEIVEVRNYLISKKADNLWNLAKYIKRWTQPKYSEWNIKVLRSVNIRENWFSDDRQEYVNEDFYNSKRSWQVKIWDVLLTSTWVWTLWRASINLSNEKYFIDWHITAFRKLEWINNCYLFSFLNSKIWQAQINKLYNGSSGQIEIYPDNLSEILISVPSDSFQKQIEKLVIESYNQKELSEKLYKESEELLLNEIWLLNYQTSRKNIILDWGYEIEVEENHSTTNYSILKELDRFDAEYWDYSYFEIVEKIKNYKWWYDKLVNLAKVSKKKITLDENKNYNYIELADINKSNWMVENTTEILWKDLPSRARMEIKKWYVLFSSLEGSIDKVAIVDSELENLVASTWFFVFKENILNKETLLVLLKLFWKNYISREALWTIMSAISNSWIERILLPKIEDEKQKIVAKKIKESFEAKNKSKNLLEVAKKAVEIYIEQDENKWLDYIKNNS